MSDRNTSKYISLILRHKPEVIGITLDEHGWAVVEDLIKGVNKTHPLDMETLERIVAEDEKQRYSFNEDKTLIRANQGHSISVDVELPEVTPPDVLYHGTGIKAKQIRSIIRELPYVVFTPPEKEFKDFEFIPVGVRKESGGYYDMEDTPLFSGTFHEMLIMSPFVNGSVLRYFNERNIGYGIKDSKYMLITRKTSLSYLKAADVSNFKIYAMHLLMA